MAREIRRVIVRSAFRIGLAIGAVNGSLAALPVVMEWIGGPHDGIGLFLFGLVVVITSSALVTAVFFALLAWVYNAVASQYGGLEIVLSR